MSLAIGIDIGGTNLRAGLWSGKGEVQRRWQESSSHVQSPQALIDLVTGIVEQLRHDNEKVHGVGIGIPGIVDAERGVVYQSPHFPEWKDVVLREALEARLAVPVLMDNDANYCALAETRFGAARGRSHVLCLTLGTGIGGGIITDGQIYHGERGFAGEVGHIVINPDGPACPCGNRGCLELYASGLSLVRQLTEANDSPAKRECLSHLSKEQAAVNAQDLGRAAAEGNAFARELFAQFGRNLGLGIASLVNVLGLHTIVVGGGVSQNWVHFAPAMLEEFKRRSYHEVARITAIRQALLGDDAGIIGAATAALDAATSGRPPDPVS